MKTSVGRSAQRLTVSEDESDVLQRQRPCPVRGVLNALRHQRMSQTDGDAVTVRGGMYRCSTPYGIRG